MKHLTTITLFLILSLCGYSQKVTTDKDGNYISVSVVKDSTQSKDTGKTYTDSKGIVYPVMISKNGKLFVVRISKKTGNPYNQYLKL